MHRKGLFFFGLIFLIFLISINAHGNLERSWQNYEPVYQLEGATETVFLTFNILWGDEHLEELLSFLEKKGFEAVFFVTGSWLKKYPEEGKKILSRGHHLGNGTLSYGRLIFFEEKEIKKEIEGFNLLCKELLGYQPTFFRSPYGEFNKKIVRIAKDEGCITLLWSINTFLLSEWENELLLTRLGENLHDGAVLLFHVNHRVNELLPVISEYLEWKGFKVGSPDIILDYFEK